MVDGVSVTITGGEKLAAHLDALLTQMASEMESVAVVGALPILNKAKQGTPVKTGTLKKSEHIGGHSSESPGTDLGDYGEVSKPVTTDGSVTVFIGTNVPYARSIEFGRSAGPSGIDSIVAKYGGAAAGGYGVARAMFRRAIDDPAVRKDSLARSQDAYRRLLKAAVGGL